MWLLVIFDSVKAKCRPGVIHVLFAPLTNGSPAARHATISPEVLYMFVKPFWIIIPIASPLRLPILQYTK